MTVLKFSVCLLSIGSVFFAPPTAWCAGEVIPSPKNDSHGAAETVVANDRLTLTAAIAEALAQSNALRAIDADIESARGEILTAKTRPNPELTISPGLKRVHESESSHNEFKGTIALTQPFRFPGKRELLVAIAERNVELRRLATDGLRFQISASVRKTFYQLIAAQKIIELRRQQLESALTFQQAAARRAETGYASEFEAVKSQGEVITARKLLGAAESELAAARVEMNFLLGREPFASLEIAGKVEDAGRERTLPELLAIALSENPGLRVQAVKAELARLNLRKAHLVRKPDFSVGPSFEYSKSEQILGFSASIELPSKGYGRGEIQTATAEQRKVLAETESLRREIVGAITKAATQLSTARSQLALYSPAYLEQLKSVVDQAERSYAQNTTSLLIYLDAKRTYFDTLAGHFEAVAEIANFRAALESAVGAPIESESLESIP